MLSLMRDGALLMDVEPLTIPHISKWAPWSATHVLRTWPSAENASRITVYAVETPEPPRPGTATAPTLRLGGVDVSLDDQAATATLCSDAKHVTGIVHLAERRASLGIVNDAPLSRSGEVSSALTLCAALLINRLGRALVHAAAIAPPEEHAPAWLLVGDTHAGKTTTTVNLMTAGWKYFSDDNVIISPRYNAARIEGWPRTFHLDTGWGTNAPQHHRTAFDPREHMSDRQRLSARLGGIIFPIVAANEPTRLEPISAAEALAGLVRQSPWLMADRQAAPAVLALLATAAQLPARRLFLGLDTFNNPTLLAQRLAPLCCPPLPNGAPNIPRVLDD